jgi:inhibitor of KinA
VIALEPAGDQAFSLTFGDGVDADLSARVLAAAERLLCARLAGVTDVVPGYGSLLVIYDPLRVAGEDVRAAIASHVEGPAPAAPARRIEIPVLYHPEVAPDLQALAEEKGLTPEALAALHAASDYRCYLVGFRPGFPFLGGLDERLVSPRLATPRPRVPAGAVGIGGRQTGVYPVESPGGWRLIGRTPVRLFDPARAEPFLVRAGDTVRFVAIDRATFEGMSG